MRRFRARLRRSGQRLFSALFAIRTTTLSSPKDFPNGRRSRRRWFSKISSTFGALRLGKRIDSTDVDTRSEDYVITIRNNRCRVGLIWPFLVLLLLGSPLQSEEVWRGLTVAPEARCSPYDPADYPYAQSVEDRIVTQLGGVYSPYTGEWFPDKYETDIEHIVARSEAHDSGLCAAGAATRTRFAQDLRNLTLASPQLNRYRKVAKDAAEWLPEKNRCWFAQRVIDVRRAYSLMIDRREARALDAVLSSCESFEMVMYPAGAAGNSEPEGEGPCGPYRNCTELRKDHPGGVPKDHCAYQSRMDRDKDGWACE